MRINKIKKTQIFLYLRFLIIPKVQKEPRKLRCPYLYLYVVALFKMIALQSNIKTEPRTESHSYPLL